MNNMRGTAVDLFAGIGAMTLAAESAGLQTTCAVGTSPKEADLYQYNFGQKPYMVIDAPWKNFPFGDLPQADYILGSIPYGGFNITRGGGRWADAWNPNWKMNYFCDQLQRCAPRGFVVALSSGNRRDLRDLIAIISEYGYRTYWQAIDSRLMTGMPVYDKRIYLVGIRKDYDVSFVFPEISSDYTYSVAEIMQKENADSKGLIEPWKIRIDPKAEIYNYRYVQERPDEEGQKSKYIADKYIRYGSWNPPALSDGRIIRRISVRELARTKFFPDEFEFGNMGNSAAYQAIGRSVNVGVATHIIEQLCMILESDVPERNTAERWKKSETEYLWNDKDESRNQPNTADKEIGKKEERENAAEPGESLDVAVSGGQEKAGSVEVTNDQNETKQKIFLSYCQKDMDIADLIEEKLYPFIQDDFYISRDLRDVRYKESFKKFMDSVRDHEYIMMIISDRYLKSMNCMYEVMEAFNEKDFEKKILFFVLSEEDRKYYQTNVSEKIAADIYDPEGQTKYMIFWREEAHRIGQQIKEINQPIDTRGLTNRLLRITKIEMDLPDFFAYISDARNLPLEEHLRTEFSELRNILYK